MEENDCIFCKIVKGDISNKKIYEDDNFIGILDVNPKTEGHSLIIPKKHFKSLLDMPSSLGNELIEACKKVSLDLINNGKGDGFNLVVNNFEVAGQVVPHLHIHIIPRKTDDGLKSIF